MCCRQLFSFDYVLIKAIFGLICIWRNSTVFSLLADMVQILLTIILLFLSLLPFSASLHAASGSTKSRPEVIYARHGAVATDDGRCSKIGMTVLREGGHAVDASVAAALCLGVVSPASSGIGGGAFMLIRQGNGKAQAFDMRETAPALASQV